MNDKSDTSRSASQVSRRDFLKAGAAATVLAASGNYAFAQASDEIRIGLIGCGGRGSGAARDAINGSQNVKIVALGDVFQDRLEGCFSGLLKTAEESAELKAKIGVTKEKCFVGFDAYKKVIASGVDMVILATPPGFRPTHLQAAINAGKHVFMEKPVAVDAPGVRTVIAAAAMATQKKLGIVAGTQRRHQNAYVETIKRLHAGAIGDIVAAQCYWNQGGLWMHKRQEAWSDMEWQLRNWLYFTWLSGDHIVEQHLHNLDVINWVMKGHPVKAMGMGGRQVRTSPDYGHIFDHFAVEYEYENGARLMSMCRQIDGCANNVSEHVIGTKGDANPGGYIGGAQKWRYEGPGNNPYVQEHTDLVASIRAGKPLNEGKSVAESTLTAIMGRMSAYTGKEITWDQALNSKENLMPFKLDFGPLPTPPVAVPGQTQLI